MQSQLRLDTISTYMPPPQALTDAAGCKILDDNKTFRLCKSNLGMFFAVAPEVGEDFAAANADLIGLAIQLSPKSL